MQEFVVQRDQKYLGRFGQAEQGANTSTSITRHSQGLKKPRRMIPSRAYLV